jgi:hypothetical protein
MIVRALGIGSDCIALHTEKGSKFIGYVGVNLFYFDTNVLREYGLYESELIDEFRPIAREGKIKLNDSKLFDIL